MKIVPSRTKIRRGPSTVCFDVGPSSIRPSARISAKAAIVAWPQWAMRRVGVKKSSRAPSVAERDTNTVSDSAVCAAMDCIAASSRPSASRTTPAGFPPVPFSVNALTIRTGMVDPANSSWVDIGVSFSMPGDYLLRGVVQDARGHRFMSRSHG